MLQKFNPKNRDLIVNINGQLVHRDKAGISPFDSAVQGGDAVWEGLRLYNGRIFKLHEHLDRLEHSAHALSIVDLPPATLIYVSCNPATLARDLAELQSRFKIESVTPLDMFPQTAEIEVVVQLQRSDASTI